MFQMIPLGAIVASKCVLSILVVIVVVGLVRVSFDATQWYAVVTLVSN